MSVSLSADQCFQKYSSMFPKISILFHSQKTSFQYLQLLCKGNPYLLFGKKNIFCRFHCLFIIPFSLAFSLTIFFPISDMILPVILVFQLEPRLGKQFMDENWIFGLWRQKLWALALQWGLPKLHWHLTPLKVSHHHRAFLSFYGTLHLVGNCH